LASSAGDAWHLDDRREAFSPGSLPSEMTEASTRGPNLSLYIAP
jgi:hypothetical protein